MSLQSTNQSFDELAKGLANGTLSRGKAIRWMGGAILGAALASVPGVAWATGCRRLGRECRRDSQCCSGNCVRRGDDKVCACPEGRTRCGERCVNLQRNERHCGSCFNRCAPGEECVEGECGGSTCDGEICGDPPLCCTAGEGCYSGNGPSGEELAICCTNDPNCVGALTVAGSLACVNGDVIDSWCDRPTCNADAECSSGEVCIRAICGVEGEVRNSCVPAC